MKPINEMTIKEVNHEYYKLLEKFSSGITVEELKFLVEARSVLDDYGRIHMSVMTYKKSVDEIYDSLMTLHEERHKKGEVRLAEGLSMFTGCGGAPVSEENQKDNQ